MVNSDNRQRDTRYWLIWAIRLGLVAAMVAAALPLSASIGQGKVLGCDQRDCSELLSDPKWSHWLGIPVSACAMLVHASGLLASVGIRHRASAQWRSGAWTVLLAVAFVLAGAAAWFVCLQWSLQTFCGFCLLSHGCGTLVSVMILAGFPFNSISAPLTGLGSTLGMLGAAVLAAGQLLHTPPTMVSVDTSGLFADRTSEAGRLPSTFPLAQPNFDIGSGRQRQVSILGQQKVLELDPMPLLGHPDAEHVSLVFLDYSCSACRRMHRCLQELIMEYPQKLAVVVMLLENRGQCVATRCALAVWRTTPDRFGEFQQWLTSGQWPPEPEQIRRKADDLIGSQPLDELLDDPWIEQYLDESKQTWLQLDYPGHIISVPMLITGPHVLRGAPRNTNELLEYLEQTVFQK